MSVHQYRKAEQGVEGHQDVMKSQSRSKYEARRSRSELEGRLKYIIMRR